MLMLHKIFPSSDKFIKWNSKFFKILSLIVVLVVILTSLTSFDIGTGSMDKNYFISTKLIKPSKGQDAVIEGHDTEYFHNKIFIKKIIGVSGDKIAIKNNKIFINDILVGKVLDKTKDKRPLTAIDANKTGLYQIVQCIPEGFVFVAGDHPRSFDSRYNEFGLVRVENLKGRAFGLW